jgi:hypothetical protein
VGRASNLQECIPYYMQHFLHLAVLIMPTLHTTAMMGETFKENSEWIQKADNAN